MNGRDRFARYGAVGVLIVTLVAGCGGASTPSATPTAAPATAAPATAAPATAAPATAVPATAVPATAAPATSAPATTAPATAAAGGTVKPGAGGPATLDAPGLVQAGAEFEVAWTGPQGQGDYVTIVTVGTVKWTNEQYFYTTGASPGKLVAPTTTGDYELWYVVGAGGAILVRRPIGVTAFQGSLSGPASVAGGSPFTVAWTGPNGPKDYVTIVAVGATAWTNESYFYTTVGSPGTLFAPVTAGAHELWYVVGTESKTMVRAPIAVTPPEVTLKAPASVAKGATFQVEWTGPNGPKDYVTIAPAGSPVGTYLSYAFTANGNPATLTAPTDAGNYEIRYASDRVTGTFASIPIVVK